MPFIGPKPADTVLDTTLIGDGTVTKVKLAADAKTKKQVDIAAGTGAAMAAASGGGAPMDQEGGALAQPEIKESPYLDVYNVTSQF